MELKIDETGKLWRRQQSPPGRALIQGKGYN